MTTPNTQLHAFLISLNQEADAATEALEALRRASHNLWDGILATHPEWCRFCVFEALLQQASEGLYEDPTRSRALVELVLRRSADLFVPAGAEFFKPLLEGLARKVYASVLLTAEDYGRAHENIEKSLQAFDAQPALQVERAAALLVWAQVQHAREATAEALTAIGQAADVFEAHYEFRRHEMALEICGGILMSQKEYALAKEVYESAYATAERLEDPVALHRLDNNLGLCAVYLHQLEEARYRLTKAYLGFNDLKLYAALRDTIVNLARETRERGNPEDAIETLYNVYAEFLDRKMPNAAAEVLVELGDTMTQLPGGAADARVTCRRLAETMAAYKDVPPAIRNAANYLRRETERSTSLDTLRRAFENVRRFLQDPSSPTTAFAAQ